jgi:hypothetical protein
MRKDGFIVNRGVESSRLKTANGICERRPEVKEIVRWVYAWAETKNPAIAGVVCRSNRREAVSARRRTMNVGYYACGPIVRLAIPAKPKKKKGERHGR